MKGQLETYKEEISCIVQEKNMLQISKDSLAEEKNVLQTLVNDSKKKILESEIRIQQYRIEKDDALAAFETDGARIAQQVSRVEYKIIIIVFIIMIILMIIYMMLIIKIYLTLEIFSFFSFDKSSSLTKFYLSSYLHFVSDFFFFS